MESHSITELSYFGKNRFIFFKDTIPIALSFCRKVTKMVNFSFKLLLHSANLYFMHFYLFVRENKRSYVLKVDKGFFLGWILHSFTETLTQ